MPWFSPVHRITATRPGSCTRRVTINERDIWAGANSLITHVAVTTDMLLEPISSVPPENAARLVIDVTIRPYKSTQDNADFA